VIVQLTVDCLAAAAPYALVALAVALARSGSGTIHLAQGQEAVAAGLTAAAEIPRADGGTSQPRRRAASARA